MDEVTLAEKSYQLVRKDLGLEEEMTFEGVENAFDRLEKYLTSQVNDLLDNDLNKLLNALYRIDIPEQTVRQLLHHSEPGKIGSNIAKAIIEREKQKVVTRLKYRT